MPTIKADYIRTPADNIRDKISRELEYHAVDGNIAHEAQVRCSPLLLEEHNNLAESHALYPPQY